ncbi:acyl-CoA dehydrogenase family protein [Nocardia brevicatena]|uniref:acyl-CoA dehydrogenase family protein n=1 Tax=Nocardia brevicatena TaxID=37327 RepID=UPI0002FBAECA|nr:acyl-CoA dehydrogenase family protein [Nocardia brevicatena]
MTPAGTLEAPWPRTEPAALNPNAEQIELRDTLRALFARHSDIEQVRTTSATELGYSPDLWRMLIEDMSVAAIAVPEDRGGLGYGTAELATILEECGRALVCEPVLTSAVLGAQALLLADDPEPVAELLESVLTGESLATVSALDPATDRVRAEREGGEWALDGTITHLLGGATADIVVTTADTPDGSRLFAFRAGPWTERSPRTVLDPTRRQADTTLRRCPALALTTPAGIPTATARRRDLTTLAVACENTGVVDRLVETTIAYTRTRHQFGRPIGSFQAIKHRLADLLVLSERARSASRYAAAAYAEDPDSARAAIAVAGAVCTEAAVTAAEEAVQLHGGVGFTWEHPAHSYYRRALGNEAAHGDARAHRARLAALLGL